jgi:hypothetical protein
MPPTRLLHRLGFRLGIPPQHYVGWHTAPTITEPGNVLWTIRDDPPVVNLRPKFSAGSMVDRQPDWRYRIDFIHSAPRTSTPSQQVPIPPSWTLEASQDTYLATAKEYKKYCEQHAAGAEIVGLNNIGEVTFEWAPGDNKSVMHQLWWWLSPAASPFPITKYAISLRLIDAAYPMPTPLKARS